jgi:hypothetical protein
MAEQFGPTAKTGELLNTPEKPQVRRPAQAAGGALYCSKEFIRAEV